MGGIFGFNPIKTKRGREIQSQKIEAKRDVKLRREERKENENQAVQDRKENRTGIRVDGRNYRVGPGNGSSFAQSADALLGGATGLVGAASQFMPGAGLLGSGVQAMAGQQTAAMQTMAPTPPADDSKDLLMILGGGGLLAFAAYVLTQQNKPAPPARSRR